MKQKYVDHSYKLLAVCFISFIVLGIIFSQVSAYLLDGLFMKFWGLVVMFALVVLFVIIYKTERIYFINGVNYKEAQKATSEQRKIYAYRHLRIFAIAAAVYVIYAVLGTLLHTSTSLDTVVLISLIIVAAFATIPIKLHR